MFPKIKHRGSMDVTFTVCCGRCSCCTKYMDARRRSDANTEAKSIGWKFTRHEGWVCPGCLAGRPVELHRFEFDGCRA